MEVLPLLQQLVPACGITVFNYRGVTYTWWLAYVRLVRSILDRRSDRG